MTLHVGLWILPTLLSLALSAIMLRPYHRTGDWDFGQVFRAFWLIPIAITWAVYFGVLLWIKSGK